MTGPEPPDGPGTFLVERYWPMADAPRLDSMLGRLRDAVHAARQSGQGVRYRGSVIVPDDELVLSLLDATSMAEARAASERAGVPFERILRAHALDFDTPDEGRSSASAAPAGHGPGGGIS